jgi:hypothetical protein
LDISHLRVRGLVGVSMAIVRTGGKAWLAETNEDEGEQHQSGTSSAGSHGGDPLDRVRLPDAGSLRERKRFDGFDPDDRGRRIGPLQVLEPAQIGPCAELPLIALVSTSNWRRMPLPA